MEELTKEEAIQALEDYKNSITTVLEDNTDTPLIPCDEGKHKKYIGDINITEGRLPFKGEELSCTKEEVSIAMLKFELESRGEFITSEQIKALRDENKNS